MRLFVRVVIIGGFIVKEVLDKRRQSELREAQKDVRELRGDVEMLKRNNDVLFRIVRGLVERRGAGPRHHEVTSKSPEMIEKLIERTE